MTAGRLAIEIGNKTISLNAKLDINKKNNRFIRILMGKFQAWMKCTQPFQPESL